MTIPGTVDDAARGAPLSAKPLRQGAVAGLVGQAVFIGAGVVVAVLLARLLTPGRFGAYVLLTTLVYLAAIVVRMGLHQVVVRATAAVHLTGGRGPGLAVARQVVVAATIATCAALPVLALLVVPWGFEPFFDGTELDGSGLLVAGIVAAEALRLVISEAFRGLHEQVRATVLGNALRMVLVLAPVLVLSALRGQLTFVGLLWLLLGASVGALAAAAACLLKAAWGRVAPAGHRRLLATYRAGLPFLVTELTAATLTMGDVVVLGHGVPDEQLALYAAASRVASLIGVPVFVAATVLAPAVASLWAAGRTDGVRVLVRGYALLVAVPALAGLVVVAVGGRPLLVLLFGPFYSAGWGYLVILAAGAFLNTVFGLSTLVLMMVGETRVVVRVTVVTAVLTVAAEFAAVQVWGAVAVAVVAALGLASQQLALTIVCARRTGIWAVPGRRRDAVLALRGAA